MPKWEGYEEVAAFLLNQFATEFGLTHVEGKQKAKGNRSGTTWEIDAKGFRQKDAGFLIVECRRYTKSRQNQEKLAALAYRIIDTGAVGGIIVSPLGLQEGAERVATAEHILNVTLDANSTRQEYVLQFLKTFMIGVRDDLPLHESNTVEIVKAPTTNSKAGH